MASQQRTEGSGLSSGNALVLTTGVAIGLGALAWMAWSAEQRSLAARPRDSAPSRSRKGSLSEGSSISTAATIAAPVPRVMQCITDRSEGEALARGLLGDDAAEFRAIEHQGDDVVSWRTADDSWLVKLVLRPVRGGRMTAVTAIVACEDDGSSQLRSGATAALGRALTRFRMWMETGELARAR